MRARPCGVGAAGADVVQEEFAVQDHVVAGEEALDACVDTHAGFLPEQLAHVGISHAFRRRPNARLRFCSAWVAAPLSRLSSVHTTTSALAVGRTG